MFQRLSTQQVSLLLTPLLLHLLLPPPLLCSSLQSHIRRTIFPIIETSFRRFVRFVRFVGFQQAHLSVVQSDCLKSREEIAESSTLHNVLPCCLPVLQSPSLPVSQSPIHPPNRLSSFECCCQSQSLPTGRRNCFFLAPTWPARRSYPRSPLELRQSYRNLILSQILCKNK